jgi:hypothetical protein
MIRIHVNNTNYIANGIPLLQQAWCARHISSSCLNIQVIHWLTDWPIYLDMYSDDQWCIIRKGLCVFPIPKLLILNWTCAHALTCIHYIHTYIASGFSHVKWSIYRWSLRIFLQTCFLWWITIEYTHYCSKTSFGLHHSNDSNAAAVYWLRTTDSV